MRESITELRKGAAASAPLAITAIVAVLLIAVGQTVRDAMATQLPSGDVVLCGGACGTAVDLVPLVLALVSLTIVAVTVAYRARLMPGQA